jgi:type IV pilus assembly protein PilV
MRAQRGSTLFEVLIAVLVLGVGILGVGAMQARSLASNHTASMRSQAVALSQDLADRMRANLTAARAGSPNNYDSVAPANNSCRAVYRTSLVVAPVNCTPTQLAADDLFDWNDRVTALLPLGAGRVCLDSTPDDGTAGANACDGAGNAYAVKVFWTERATRAGTVEPKRFVTTVRP